jgi:hypothetical protein
MSHTPEPWEVTDLRYIRQSNEPRHVVARASKMGGMEANARRIVACVNACAGFNTGQLENVLLFGDTLKQRFMVLSNLETELRCQRDGLLLALEYAIRQHQGLATVQGIAMAIEAVKGTET